MRTELALVLMLALGCSKTESNEGKRMPQLAPPPGGGTPATVSIAVAVDGQPRPPITAATLAATAPDWSDAPRRAWRIARLVGIDANAQVTFAITGTRGVSIEMPAESTEHALVPALLLSQRGQIVAEFVDPSTPFPAFHGEGGRLGRPPDTTPRVSNVTKIEVRHR